MLRLVSSVFLSLSFIAINAACASAQTRQRRSAPASAPGQRTVNSSRFAGQNVCAKIQAAVDSLGAAGGTVVAHAAGDCGDRTQVRVRAGVTLRLPPGTFTYSMRGYGGPGNTVGALFLLDSDSTLEGSGPDTVIRESSWVHTSLTEAEQRAAISNGEYIATFKVIMPTAHARVSGSTSRNITIRNLRVARGKPDGPGSFNSAGGAVDFGNCHNCRFEGNVLDTTRSIGVHFGAQPTLGDDPGFDLRERGVTEPLGRYASNVVVQNNVFEFVASQNVAFVNAQDGLIYRNRFLRPGQLGGPGTHPIDLEPNQLGDRLLRIRVAENFIDARGTGHVATVGNAIIVQSGDAQLIGDITVEDNEIIGGGLEPVGPNGSTVLTNRVSNGIYVFGPHMKDVVVRRNRITRTGQAGINIEGTRIHVLDNHLTDVGGGGTPGFLMRRVVDSRIEGNVFHYTGAGPADSRIVMAAGSRNNTFRNNRGFAPVEEGP